MDALASSNGADIKSEFSPHSWIEPESDKPDLYSEPDLAHGFPLGENPDAASSDIEVDQSVLRLLSGQVAPDDKTLPFKITHLKGDENFASTRPIPAPFNSVEINPASTLLSVTTVSSPSAEPTHGRDIDCVAENGDSIEDKLQLLPLPKNKSQRRPGVILLGRGNSFSLGRSEVIFLHNTKPYRRKGKDTQQQQNTRVVTNGRLDHGELALHSTGETAAAAPTTSPTAGPDSSSNSDLPAAFGAGSTDDEPSRPSPPPLSNRDDVQSGGVSSGNHTSRPLVFTGGRSTVQSSGNSPGFSHGSATNTNSAVFEKHRDKESTSDELAALWARAELVMAGKQRAVLDVLAQFGVGDGHKDEEEEEEEEDGVWQVVESKGYAVDR